MQVELTKAQVDSLLTFLVGASVGHPYKPVKEGDKETIRRANAGAGSPMGRWSEECWNCFGDWFDRPVDPFKPERTFADLHHESYAEWQEMLNFVRDIQQRFEQESPENECDFCVDMTDLIDCPVCGGEKGASDD